MMDHVDDAEHRLQMQKAVAPIKVSVVEQDHDGNASEKVKPATFRHLEINHRVGADRGTEDDRAHHSVDHASGHGVTDFAKVISLRWETFLNLAMGEKAPEENVKDRVGRAGEKR